MAAALKRDEISRYALLALSMAMLDYPELESEEIALDTPDAENWAQAIKQDIGSIQRCDLLSDPMKLSPNGRVVGIKWVPSKASGQGLYADI